MSSIQWKEIPQDLAAAKTKRILDIISRAERRIKLQRVSQKNLPDQQLRRKVLAATLPESVNSTL